MNNQIDKLLVKAGAYFGGEGVDYSNFDPKKFAELLIRKCALVGLETHGNYDVHDDILKHFGVEE